MANRLTMAEIDRILTLHTTEHSNREIADLLGINRETVGKYVARAKAQNQPNAPSGSNGTSPSGPRSECEPFRDLILAKVEQGFLAKRIHQDLAEDHGESTPSYYSVRRFIARLMQKTPLPFRRMETEPGEEAQVDFGTGAPVRMADGKVRRPWVFRIVLSYSRKAYSEAVWRQSTESFITCLENAFRHFGGVPKRLVIDNLKAAVARADWYDPEIHPKLQSFAQHYGTVILPTKPYMPRHKGKVESGVKYVKRNALKGRIFTSLAEENQFLMNWETQVADQRIHGTTKQQVEKLFASGAASIAAVACRAVPVLPRGASRRASGRAFGSGQGVLFSAAGIRGASAVGAMGRPIGPRVQRSLGTGCGPCQGRARAVPHGGRAHSEGKSLGGGTWHRRLAAAGGHRRAEHAAMGRGDDPGPWRRGRARAGGPETSGGQASERRFGRGLPRGADAWGLSSAGDSPTVGPSWARATPIRVSRIASDHSSSERLFARIFTPIPKGA